MERSQNTRSFEAFGTIFSPELEGLEIYELSPADNLDQIFSPDNVSERTEFCHETSNVYFPIESSTSSSLPAHDSSSTLSFSPDGSPKPPQSSQSHQSALYHSHNHISNSVAQRPCSEDDVQEMKHKIRELENAMLGPDHEMTQTYRCPNLHFPVQVSSETEMWKQVLEMNRGGELKQALVACARYVGDNDLVTAEWLMTELRKMVSVRGEPIQRLGAYMLEGLVSRLASSGTSIYKALRCKEPTSAELQSYMHLLYEVCPYFKFGYMSANGAIADAMKDESQIHIIDFLIAQGSQWVTLIQALAARPGGPPRICITGIDDSVSAYARGGGLEIVGQRLAKLAESCKVPFEFHAAPVSASELEVKHLNIKPGEALAVNFAMVLHHMPDESVGTQNHRDRLLRMVKSLSPKVVTLVEQELNTNTPPFLPRFLETLEYYLAIFESIDVALPREHKERISVEQHCLARDMVNIIACEGVDRVERHELLGKWRSRFSMAGFTPCPLSSLVNATIKTLLDKYCKNYTLEERDGALYLGWMNQDLVASCAWR